MQRISFAVGAGLSTYLAAGLAFAHVSIVSGPGFADTSQEVTFGVGHGCEGLDTQSVRVHIPSEVISVRSVDSTFGPASVETDEAGLVTAVVWEKPEASLLDADTSYYKLTLRLRVPDRPFSTLYFPATQVCRDAEGEAVVVEWSSTDPEATEEEPAPTLTILPKRYSGWNKFTVSAAVPDLAVYFSDAVIVWKDDAAFSINPLTVEQIAETEGVSPLTALAAGDEIWVKY